MYKTGRKEHNNIRIFADIHEKEFTLFFLFIIINMESDKYELYFL